MSPTHWVVKRWTAWKIVSQMLCKRPSRLSFIARRKLSTSSSAWAAPGSRGGAGPRPSIRDWMSAVACATDRRPLSISRSSRVSASPTVRRTAACRDGVHELTVAMMSSTRASAAWAMRCSVCSRSPTSAAPNYLAFAPRPSARRRPGTLAGPQACASRGSLHIGPNGPAPSTAWRSAVGPACLGRRIALVAPRSVCGPSQRVLPGTLRRVGSPVPAFGSAGRSARANDLRVDASIRDQGASGGP